MTYSNGDTFVGSWNRNKKNGIGKASFVGKGTYHGNS